jgi:ABC-2 type transport system ATP-binding protein
VLSAGVGTRDATGYAIRLATFRLEQSELGRAVLGIVTPRSAASAAVVGLLSGRIAPAYGELRVLGHDMTTPAGRAAVRRRVGIARRGGRVWPTTTVRKLVERAAGRSASLTADRRLLVAAILDRLGLMPWAEVPLRAAPDLVARRARLAAACVHEPSLLIIDGLFDNLGVRDRAILAGVVTELERDMSVVAIERDADSLLLFCDQVIMLTDGILLGRASPPTPMYELTKVAPLDHAR